MSAAVDHLGAHKLVRIVSGFEDANGAVFEAGETGRIQHIHFDWATSVVTIELVQGEDLKKIVLHQHNSKSSGPRSGNLRQYFEVTERKWFGAQRKSDLLSQFSLKNHCRFRLSCLLD